MEEISKQVGWGVPVRLSTRVQDLKSLESKMIVVAAEGPEAARLLGTAPPKEWRAVKCFYFAADHAPVEDPIIVLNGDGKGPVNNFCVVSAVAPGYAPPGAALLSASVLGDASEAQVLDHMETWFGAQVRRWLHLRTYDVTYAQPDQSSLPSAYRPVLVRKGLYVCGDHVANASLNGAIRSGQLASDAVLAEL